jgi:hypothetical protein
MARLLSDDTLRGELIAKGARQADRFRWAETGRRTLDAFERLIQSGAGPQS